MSLSALRRLAELVDRRGTDGTTRRGDGQVVLDYPTLPIGFQTGQPDRRVLVNMEQIRIEYETDISIYIDAEKHGNRGGWTFKNPDEGVHSCKTPKNPELSLYQASVR